MKPEHMQTNVLLAPYTTLHIGGHAEYFLDVHTEEELMVAVRWAKGEGIPVTVIGGGSNLLISDKGIRGLVLHMGITGITYEEVTAERVRVTVGAGVMLDDMVRDVVARSLWGIENLSAIPGTVGGMVVQNAGAYGVEAKDFVESVRVYDHVEDAVQIFDKDACEFEYRDSRFKRFGGERYSVLSAVILVRRDASQVIRRAELNTYWDSAYTPTLLEVRDAIIVIRAQKLPDWRVLGTAGSFFKNPVVPRDLSSTLQEQYPDMPVFSQPDGNDKLLLGWILDHVLGMKGYRLGNVGLYEKQALVLVNYGGATAREVIACADTVAHAVFEKTNITIEYEVKCVA